MKPNLIGGEWVTSSSGVENINPSNTNDLIDVFAQSGRAEAEQAVAAAASEFEAWSLTPVQQRHGIQKDIGDTILARKAEIGEMLAREEGKILPEAIAETERAGRIFLFFAAEALRLTGELLPSVRPRVSVEVTREPVGPVGLVTPWNFPIAIPAWKIAPALCFGNSVVFKPAEQVPGTAWLLAEIIDMSGLP